MRRFLLAVAMMLAMWTAVGAGLVFVFAVVQSQPGLTLASGAVGFVAYVGFKQLGDLLIRSQPSPRR